MSVWLKTPKAGRTSLFSSSRTVGTMLGEYITNFVTDWDKVSATVSGYSNLLSRQRCPQLSTKM